MGEEWLVGVQLVVKFIFNIFMILCEKPMLLESTKIFQLKLFAPIGIDWMIGENDLVI